MGVGAVKTFVPAAVEGVRGNPGAGSPETATASSFPIPPGVGEADGNERDWVQ